jgi:hypothetical protein
VVEWTLHNPGPAPADATWQCELLVDDHEAVPACEAALDGDLVRFRSGDRTLALLDGSGRAGLELSLATTTVYLRGDLAGNATATFRALLPLWPATPDELTELVAHPPTVSDVRSYWSSQLAGAMQVDIPEPLLADVIRASQVYCLMAAREEEQGERISAWIASDRYGPLESEAHSIVSGMDLFGHHDFSRRALDFFIHRYNAQGYLTTGYTVVGTGWHLWTLAEHYELTHDDAWLKANAADVLRVCRWIEAQREKTLHTWADGSKVVEYGLQPPGVAADWGMYCYRFFNAGHFCAGLGGAANALNEVGTPGAEALLSDAVAFRQDILTSYHRCQALTPGIELSDGITRPGIPSMANVFGLVADYFPGADGNRSWANDVELGSHHLVALGVMPPDASDVEWTAQTLEDYWFLQTGMGDYPADASHADPFGLGGFAKIQPYYGRLAEVYAQRDEVRPFIRAYFNAIPSLLNTENLSLWEHFHNMGAWNKTHETGWLLRQTRLMYVQERADELWLAPFVTTHWMADGQHVAVTNAPTRFGPVSYRLESHAADGWLEATVDPPRRSTPKDVVIRLRHPDGKRIVSVTVDGQKHGGFDADRECVRLGPLTKPVVVRAEYQG